MKTCKNACKKKKKRLRSTCTLAWSDESLHLSYKLSLKQRLGSGHKANAVCCEGVWSDYMTFYRLHELAYLSHHHEMITTNFEQR